jgi:hypothetical protein
MLYSVSQRHHFSEVSRTVPAGGTIYLDEAIAQKYLAEWPGLLAPIRQTTEGSPQKIRASEPPAVPRNDDRRTNRRANRSNVARSSFISLPSPLLMLQSNATFRTLTDAATVAVDFNVAENNASHRRREPNIHVRQRQIRSTCMRSRSSRTRPVHASLHGLLLSSGQVALRRRSPPRLLETDLIVFLFDGTNYLDVAIVKDFNLA